MQKIVKLYPGEFYHIYDRGNNKENIFLENQNYTYFLKLWKKYIFPIADTWAYCLMKNHFHVLVQIHQAIQTSKVSKTLEVSHYISQQFSNLFNAYAKAINKKYTRTGSLFQTRFGRKLVERNAHLVHLVYYSHFNPQKHRFVQDFKDYPFSSYHTILAGQATSLDRRSVLELFGDAQEFIEFHRRGSNFAGIQYLVEEDEL